ncbi:hypothetical protein PANDA_005164 [Ailuropoda melanoleuca]|uniref:Rab-GAP TBC domain-containing protein n=1 Tax=Ailuropoda melanoleuca TaxID=9646 RepID=D2H5I7_AILME|nr:hypothetical protein PANDA_005164 [Ailuropoda melanoleuca]
MLVQKNIGIIFGNSLKTSAKDSAQESVITRDIHRTFPAHDYFKDTGGDGQESLYKICKAYSVYDEDIGYCQGQSFLAAVLLLHKEAVKLGDCFHSVLVQMVDPYQHLLPNNDYIMIDSQNMHMPEEQAFCVLVKIMYDYGLRDLYKNNFEDLHCKFYQLERLIQENDSNLHGYELMFSYKWNAKKFSDGKVDFSKVIILTKKQCQSAVILLKDPIAK